MCSPLEVREPITNTLIGCLVFPDGKVKYVPIHPMVANALRVLKMAKRVPYEEVEPQWEELSKEDDIELQKLNSLDVHYLVRQAH